MRRYTTTVSSSPAIKNGVLVLSGYGLRIIVVRGHLAVSDGICEDRRRIRLPRATCGLKRLVVLGHTGFITLEALRWLQDIGAALSVIDPNGQVILASVPAGHPGAHLLRAQALAASKGTGLVIVRDLLREKLRGEATVLHRLDGANSAIERITHGVDSLEGGKTLDQLRAVEAEAGAAYWKAWESLPIHFGHRDHERIPEHWRTFGVRHSPLTASPRSAVNPANALLNYLYAMLETEARIAARAIGLDPGIGLLHADLAYRDSLACDLMEPVRPRVDAFVLDMLHTRTFRANDFVETRRGVCRVSSELTMFLGETAPTWAQAVAPIAERVARALLPGKMKRQSGPLPTPLTQFNRIAGRDRLRRRPRNPSSPDSSRIPPACRGCGVVLDNRRRKYCDECFAEYRKEMIGAWAQSGIKALAQRRVVGWDPAHGGHAGYERGRKNTKHMRAAIEWGRKHERMIDEREFRDVILLRLQNVPLGVMAKATGFSVAYCSFIRRGLRVPHPRHWESLREACALGVQEEP
jgi:CRISPR-associated endonuclease Cas1